MGTAVWYFEEILRPACSQSAVQEARIIMRRLQVSVLHDSMFGGELDG